VAWAVSLRNRQSLTGGATTWRTMSTTPNRLERFRGCLLGLAVGDALGAPLIGMKSAHVRQVYGEIDDYVDAALAWKGRPYRWALPGLYTNNTQRALAMADVLARDGRCEPRALAEVLVEMADAHVEGGACGCHRRVSRNFRAALERMRLPEGDPSACGGTSPGCGAAARVAPLALFYAGQPDPLARAVIETTLVTHRDARSLAAALAVALAVAQAVGQVGNPSRRSRTAEAARLLAEQMKDAWQSLPAISQPLQTGFQSVPLALDLLPRLLEEGDDTLAYESIVREANRCAPERPVHDPSEGFAPAAASTALYLALSGRSFPEAVAAAVSLGRDAHDVGAMVGAIVGAREGVEAIPAPWISRLRNAGQVRLRADNLERGAVDYSTWRGIVELESEATAAEERERRRLAERWEKEGVLVKKPPRAKPARQPDLGFAPPPEKWLRRQSFERDREKRKQRKKDKGGRRE